jgi:hypothetical protein
MHLHRETLLPFFAHFSRVIRELVCGSVRFLISACLFFKCFEVNKSVRDYGASPRGARERRSALGGRQGTSGVMGRELQISLSVMKVI